MKKKNSFWNKVMKCEHKWGEYYDGGSCETPYCGWSEVRCKKCGVYKVSCGCGYNNGYDGWPKRRRDKWYKKKHSLKEKDICK